MSKKVEDGSASVGTVGALILIIFIALIGVVIGRVEGEKIRLQGVADMAALAGGPYAATSVWTSREQQACEAADKVAHANATHLTSCRVEQGDIYVEISSEGVIWGVPVQVRAYARAGPAGE